MHTSLALRRGVAAFSFLVLAGLIQASPFTNGGFDSSSGGPTSFTGLSAGGVSAASVWNVWNNTTSTTTTELLATTDPFGSGSMIHVTTGGNQNGLYQFFDFLVGTASVDVYVLRGKVTLFSVGGPSATSLLTGAWETLSLSSSGTNEFALYGTATDGGDFYADRLLVPAGAPLPAPVGGVPETGSMLVSLGILLPVALRLLQSYRARSVS